MWWEGLAAHAAEAEAATDSPVNNATDVQKRERLALVRAILSAHEERLLRSMREARKTSPAPRWLEGSTWKSGLAR